MGRVVFGAVINSDAADSGAEEVGVEPGRQSVRQTTTQIGGHTGRSTWPASTRRAASTVPHCCWCCPTGCSSAAGGRCAGWPRMPIWRGSPMVILTPGTLFAGHGAQPLPGPAVGRRQVGSSRPAPVERDGYGYRKPSPRPRVRHHRTTSDWRRAHGLKPPRPPTANRLAPPFTGTDDCGSAGGRPAGDDER